MYTTTSRTLCVGTLLVSILLPAVAQGDAGDQDLDEDSFTVQEGDCDDGRSDTWPGAVEQCWDGQDQDCNGDADDACMYLGSTRIELARRAGQNTYTVSYPSDSDETVAFLAVNQITEHSDDQCDYVTTMTDQGGSYQFTIALEHCGYGHNNRTHAFEADAIVFARRGGPGGFTSFDLSSLPTLNNHRDQGSATVGTSDATQDVPICSMYSADGQGCAEASWYCSVSQNNGILDGEIYENYGESDTFNEARYINLGLGNNLEISQQSFSCRSGNSYTLTHTVSTALGTDHAAFVLPMSWDTGNRKDHLSYESTCTLSGSIYTCDITCYGSGRSVSGQVLFVDGSFQ